MPCMLSKFFLRAFAYASQADAWESVMESSAFRNAILPCANVGAPPSSHIGQLPNPIPDPRPQPGPCIIPYPPIMPQPGPRCWAVTCVAAPATRLSARRDDKRTEGFIVKTPKLRHPRAGQHLEPGPERR